MSSQLRRPRNSMCLRSSMVLLAMAWTAGSTSASEVTQASPNFCLAGRHQGTQGVFLRYDVRAELGELIRDFHIERVAGLEGRPIPSQGTRGEWSCDPHTVPFQDEDGVRHQKEIFSWWGDSSEAIRENETRRFTIFIPGVDCNDVANRMRNAHWATTTNGARGYDKDRDVIDSSHNDAASGIPSRQVSVVASVAFRPRQQVVSASVPGYDDFQPTITGDGNTLLWSSDRPGGVGGMDLWLSERALTSTTFGAASNVAALNSPQDESYASLRSDGLEIFFATNRPGGLGGFDLWTATRPDRMSPWTTPYPVTELASPYDDTDPSLSGDGLDLFFTSDQPGSLGGGAIWQAHRTSRTAPWSFPTRIADIDTTFVEHSPAISPDGGTLVFASTRPGSSGSSDFYLVEREASSGAFGLPLPIDEWNTAAWDFNGCWSGDMFSFYYSSYAPGSTTADIFRADSFLPLTDVEHPVDTRHPLIVHARRDPQTDIAGLAVSFATMTPFVVPELDGKLLLAPPIIDLGAGFCDARGRVSFVFPDPVGLAGLRLYFQSFAMDPATEVYFGTLSEVEILP